MGPSATQIETQPYKSATRKIIYLYLFLSKFKMKTMQKHEQRQKNTSFKLGEKLTLTIFTNLYHTRAYL